MSVLGFIFMPSPGYVRRAAYLWQSRRGAVQLAAFGMILSLVGMACAEPALETFVNAPGFIYPNSLLRGNDGNFYCTTRFGGASGKGIIIRLTPAGVQSTLVEFAGLADGSDPVKLVQGNDGNFYGITSGLGALSYGTFFRVTPAGVLTTLVTFAGYGEGGNRGGNPFDLILGRDGNCYGVTNAGGATNSGTFFRVTLAGEITTLVDFQSAAAPGTSPNPFCVVQGGNGNFYGATFSFSSSIFRITPGGTAATLVANPGYGVRGLVAGGDGNIYGVTSSGGASGNGTVFRVTTDEVLSTLGEFTGTGGRSSGDLPLWLARGGQQRQPLRHHPRWRGVRQRHNFPRNPRWDAEHARAV